MTDSPYAARCARSRELVARARRVIPGGIHLTGRPLVDVDTTPMYFEHGAGARLRDVDGHEYVDFLMGFGPYLLGYAHPEVDRAGNEAAARGRVLSLSHPAHVAFIEALLPRFPGAEMGVHFRTGSDATTAALRIARRATGRRRVARCGYHGWHDWCVPLEDFVPAGLDEQVPEFSARDPETLRAILERFPGEIAAVIVAPEMVTPFSADTLHRLARLARDAGAVFVMDEVKTGLRAPLGSISRWIGLTPDVITVSKALGNGWATAAVLGSRAVMEHGAGMHYSGTFHGDVSAMAAALATLRIVEATDAGATAARHGRALLAGLASLAREHGLPAEAYGEPLDAMPFFRFVGERAPELTAAFYREVLARGVLLHPRHMWFPSAAHTDADLAFSLEAADHAMARAARVLG